MNRQHPASDGARLKSDTVTAQTKSARIKPPIYSEALFIVHQYLVGDLIPKFRIFAISNFPAGVSAQAEPCECGLLETAGEPA